MAVALPTLQTNRVLASLPLALQHDVSSLVEPVTLGPKQVLYEPGAAVDAVYFPISAGISLLTLLEGTVVVELTLVGTDGMVGLSLFLGEAAAVHRAVTQIPGVALRLEGAAFAAAVAREPELRSLLSRYTRLRLLQLAQTAACNTHHPLEQRCARWLLQTQQALGAAAFPATHDVLAAMLGVRRPSLTPVAGVLQQAGLIRYQRGRIHIVDRARLEATACPCYRRIVGAIDQVLGPVSR